MSEVIPMKRTLEALWNGDLAPGQTSGVGDPELEHLTVLLDRNREQLKQELTQPQMELFERYVDCADEFACLSAAQAFCDGFSLASKLLTEALSEDT